MSMFARARAIALTVIPLIVLAGCSAGSLPTNGKLPEVDGSALTNVNVSSVGGVTAGDIAAGVKAVDAATDANTPSTLVHRDSNGSISVGSVNGNLTGNVTGFATGAQGANLTSASTVTFGRDGNYFRVKNFDRVLSCRRRHRRHFGGCLRVLRRCHVCGKYS